MNRTKNPHKPTVNWTGKGWKIHQMKVIFHKCSLFQTPSQQGAILENDQEGVTGSGQWAPYSLGRRDVPPDNLIKKVFSEPFACLLHRCFINNLYFVCAFCYKYKPKHLLSMCPVPVFCPQTVHSHNPSSHQSHNTHMIVTSSSSSSSTTPHRVVNQQGYDGMMSKGGQYQPGMPLSVVPSGGPGQYQGNMPQGTLVCGMCEMLWRLNGVKLSSSLMLLWIKPCPDASL